MLLPSRPLPRTAHTATVAVAAHHQRRVAAIATTPPPPQHRVNIMATSSLTSLTADILALIAKRLPSVEDVCAMRLAARCLRAPGARAVQRLRAAKGQLPEEAWAVFPEAAGLLLELFGTFHAIEDLLGSLPQRLGDLEITAVEDRFLAGHVVEVFGYLLAQELVRSPSCAPSLARLTIQPTFLEPQHVQALLRGLPSLERCSLSMQAGRAVQRICSFPAPLQELQLTCLDFSGQLDVAALAASSGLTSLHLTVRDTAQLHAVSDIAGLQQLRHLGLHVSSSRARQQAVPGVIAAASQLPHLRSLDLGDADISAQQWHQLVEGLPGLEELCVAQIQMCPGSPAAPSLTSLRGCVEFVGVGAAAPFSDALAACLPALQRLEARWDPESATSLFMVLRGQSPHLTELRLGKRDRSSAELPDWPQQHLLGSFPQLRRLELDSLAFHSLGDLLADAAGCAQLEELEVSVDRDVARRLGARAAGEGEVMGAWLAALVAGACSGCLRRLVLGRSLPWAFALDAEPGDDAIRDLCYERGEEEEAETQFCFGIASAAQLLRPGAMPQLRELQLDVALPPQPDGEEEIEGVEADVLQRVAQELEALGVEGAAACFSIVQALPRRGGGPVLRLPKGVALAGWLGGCEVRLHVWLSEEDREDYGLV